MNTTIGNSAVFIRTSKIIWKPNLNLNIGMSDVENFTSKYSIQNNSGFEKIELEDYILNVLALVLVLLGLLFSYICFLKWVAKGNLDLPRFGGGGQLVFNCFPDRSGIKKSESTQVLEDILENAAVQESFEKTVEQEEKDSTEIMEFHCDID